ncbi:hypothetical protein MKY09_03445 [Psychrobacillus sp. FSL K6-4046]|uniref:hypothetical protein n=1 Tax=Psychrobacillus sp. FSL K6-4046 TaxID=2921550 RepID=UPI003159C83A
MMYVYVIYLILSAIILFFITQRNVKEWILKIIVVSFLPVIGWLLPIQWPKRAIVNKGDELDSYINQMNEDIALEILLSQEKIDKEKELNIVPIEDALVISNYTARRKAMINVLKENPLEYMEVIKTAVLNEDPETSHYAVTAVMEVKRKLSIAIMELSDAYHSNKQDVANAISYTNAIKSYMNSGFLDEQTLKKYKYLYIEVLEQLILHNVSEEHIYKEKFRAEVEMKEYLAAETTCKQYQKKFPASEEPYICFIELFYTTKSSIKLQETLNRLKNSTIQFSNRGLTIVRYWSEGFEHEANRELL